MKKLVLAFGILASVVSVGIGAMSEEELRRTVYNCSKEDKSACQALINNGLPSVEQCNKSYGKNDCVAVGTVYFVAERYREAIPYFEKAIALGDNRGYVLLGDVYYELQDYFNAKKYYEMGCNKGNGDTFQSEPCYRLGYMYVNGKGVRENPHKGYELYKKACDMEYAYACVAMGRLYAYGLDGVKPNVSIGKEYFGKACDLGEQVGCDNYKAYNERGW